MQRILRNHTLTDDGIPLTTSVANAGSFLMGGAAGGMLYCVSTSSGSAITLNFQTDCNSGTPNDLATRFLVTDGANAAVAVTIQPGRCAALPDALFGAGRVYPVITNAGVTAVVRIGLKT